MTNEELEAALFNLIVNTAKKNGPRSGEKAAAAVLDVVANVFESVRDGFEGLGGADFNFKAGWSEFARKVRALSKELVPEKFAEKIESRFRIDDRILKVMGKDPTKSFTIPEINEILEVENLIPRSTEVYGGMKRLILLSLVEMEGYANYRLTKSGKYAAEHVDL